MPFMGQTKGSKQRGYQTHARALSLLPELQDVELEYLSMREWYVNTVGLKAQFDEALAQAKASGDEAFAAECGNKIFAIQASLEDARQRCRVAGERSFAEAYHLAASKMLPREIEKIIDMEAENLLGRPRHELRQKR